MSSTQIKLVYNYIRKSTKAKCSYNQFYSNSDTFTSEPLFLQWYEEVKSKVEGSE